MNFATLFDKLLEIERAISRRDFAVILGLTMEAEDIVLELERLTIDELEHPGTLRRAA